MATKLRKSQIQAVARYQANSERWTATAKNGTERQKLLKKAKSDKQFVNHFWEWLKTQYSDDNNSS